MKAPPMGTKADAVRRLGRVRRELDEAAEWVGRMTDEIENAKPPVVDANLVGAQEAREILGLGNNGFNSQRRQGKLPEPLVTLACGPIWLRETIEQEARRRAA